MLESFLDLQGALISTYIATMDLACARWAALRHISREVAILFLSSSVVEHLTVNKNVARSNRAWGAMVPSFIG